MGYEILKNEKDNFGINGRRECNERNLIKVIYIFNNICLIEKKMSSTDEQTFCLAFVKKICMCFFFFVGKKMLGHESHSVSKLIIIILRITLSWTNVKRTTMVFSSVKKDSVSMLKI